MYVSWLIHQGNLKLINYDNWRTVTMEDSLEEVHEELLAWAEHEGVEMDSIRPMRLSGRGFGSKSGQK